MIMLWHFYNFYCLIFIKYFVVKEMYKCQWAVYGNTPLCRIQLYITVIEGLRERTEYIDIFLFLRPSFNHVLFPMFCLLVEGECRILVF